MRASSGPRAAEIIRYTYDGWSPADVERFQKMLTEQYVPSLINGSGENGNKELSMSEALINIGVFNDDRETFDARREDVARPRARVHLSVHRRPDAAQGRGLGDRCPSGATRA